MLYLLQIYALVIAVVLVPLLFLYLALALARMAMSTVSISFRNLTNAAPTGTAFQRERWSLIHR